MSADRLGELGTADRRNRNLIWTPARRNVRPTMPITTMVSFLATFAWTGQLGLRLILRSPDLPCESLPGFGAARAENVVRDGAGSGAPDPLILAAL